MTMTPERDYAGWTKYIWLIYVVPFAAFPVVANASAGRIALTWFATAIFVVIYLAGYRVRGRRLLWIIAAITVFGVAFMPTNYGAGAFFIFAASFAGNTGGVRKAFSIIGIVLIVLLVDVLVIGLSPLLWWWAAFFTVVIGAVNAHFSQVGRANKRLAMAHDEIEHLAKVAERERIARDLHDVLGHTLSVIILKSELAAKLMDRDPEKAGKEIREVEQISRQALGDVRDAIRGYRSQGLAAELAQAKCTLETAGLTVQCDASTTVKLPAVQESVLSLAVREAVTNVVRHAQARTCSLRLEQQNGSCRLEIHDDGRGGENLEGNGLRGMRERVEMLGGTLNRRTDAGTKLTITLPLRDVTPKGESCDH
jgi:two-component system sensor histidine kinase DesK